MEPEKFKTHRAKRKWTTLVIRRKTILSQFLPTSEEGSLHFWRASRLSLPLHSVEFQLWNSGDITNPVSFLPSISLTLCFISHTGISSPAHTALSLARAQWFPQAAKQGGQDCCSYLPPAISVTDGPHCHTTPQLLLLQPVLFCDWNCLFLNGQCDFSQSDICIQPSPDRNWKITAKII